MVEKREEQLELLRNIKIPRRFSKIDLKDNEKHLHAFMIVAKLSMLHIFF